MKVTPAKEADSLQVEAPGAEGAASTVEVENVVQKEYLGTGQSVDEDEVRLLNLLYLKLIYAYKNHFTFSRIIHQKKSLTQAIFLPIILWYERATLSHMTSKYG